MYVCMYVCMYIYIYIYICGGFPRPVTTKYAKADTFYERNEQTHTLRIEKT